MRGHTVVHNPYPPRRYEEALPEQGEGGETLLHYLLSVVLTSKTMTTYSYACSVILVFFFAGHTCILIL